MPGLAGQFRNLSSNPGIHTCIPMPFQILHSYEKCELRHMQGVGFVDMDALLLLLVNEHVEGRCPRSPMLFPRRVTDLFTGRSAAAASDVATARNAAVAAMADLSSEAEGRGIVHSLESVPTPARSRPLLSTQPSRAAASSRPTSARGCPTSRPSSPSICSTSPRSTTCVTSASPLLTPHPGAATHQWHDTKTLSPLQSPPRSPTMASRTDSFRTGRLELFRPPVGPGATLAAAPNLSSQKASQQVNAGIGSSMYQPRILMSAAGNPDTFKTGTRT